MPPALVTNELARCTWLTDDIRSELFDFAHAIGLVGTLPLYQGDHLQSGNFLVRQPD